MKKSKFKSNYEDDLDLDFKKSKKTKFNPKHNYPEDIEIDKKLAEEEQEEPISPLLNEVELFKELNRNQLDGIKEIISSIESAVKLSLHDYPNLTYNHVEEEIVNLLNHYITPLNSPTKNKLYLYKTIESLLKKPVIINTILSTQDMKDYLNFSARYQYSSNIKENYKALLNDTFINLQPLLTDELKQKMLTNTLSDKDKKYIQSIVCKFISIFYQNNYDKEILNGYNKIITNSLTVLDFCGLLRKNNGVNNYRMCYLDLDFLGYDYYDNNDNNTNKSTIKRPSIESLMDESFVKNFNKEELIALSAFYCNRLAKCSISYNDSLYLLYKTDFLRKLYNDRNSKFDLTDDQILTLLAQHNILEKTARTYINKQLKKKRKEFSDVFLFEDLHSKEITSLLNKYGAFYSDFFAETLPDCEHDLLKDLEKSINMQTTIDYLYSIKKHCLESLLMSLIDKDKEINWGVVLDKINIAKYNNDRSNNFLIGIDMKEFNMPIKFHCEQEQIEEFLLNYTGKPIIPVYEGNEDFLVDNTYFSTQILHKLSKDQRKLLHKAAEEISPDNKNYKFVQHLQWMSHPNRKPEFIKNEKQYYNIQTDKVLDEKDIDK